MTLEKLLEYYNEHDESNRLHRDNQNKIEFLITCSYIQKYLQQNAKVLDVGSGPGQYSIFCAENGAHVDALDIVPKNLHDLNERIVSRGLEERIIVHEGNAVDLSKFADESFDLVLNMGPLYHLKSQEEKELAVSESLRVLKNSGVLLSAYINKYYKFYQRVVKNDKPIKWDILDSIVKHGRKFDGDEAVFFFLFPHEAEDLFHKHSGDILHHVCTDGISPMIASAVNDMSEADFARFMEYQLQFCENPHLLGLSLHNLIVFRK